MLSGLISMALAVPEVGVGSDSESCKGVVRGVVRSIVSSLNTRKD